jgi:hypothetical protein
MHQELCCNFEIFLPNSKSRETCLKRNDQKGLNLHLTPNKNIKDAGFVSESFQNETNKVILDFCFHETKPQNESFKNRSTKQIHKTNLSKTGLRNKSMKQIF